MASSGATKHARIQRKHVLTAIIVIVSTLSFAASIVLITIGYLNPFGTVGLGILGGGCVLYFATILFLCPSGIWVKNRYYADENDAKEKLPSSTEDTFLLKRDVNVTSPANNDTGCINETECESDNMVPLYSVSTVYSSVSSVSTVPDRTMFHSWQGSEADGALDCDVFSSSLTAVQQTDIKVQEKMKLKSGSIEQIKGDLTSECKIKDLETMKIADVPILHSNGESLSDTPRQRKPVMIDFVGTTCSSTEEMHISGQSKDENNTNTQICGRNNMSNVLYPVEGPPSSAAQSKHLHHMAQQPKYLRKATNELPMKYNQGCKPEKQTISTGVKKQPNT